MSFSDNEEKKLIKLVSEHPALYNPNDDEYHNYLVKETTWQSIGKVLDKPGEECKRKWKFIRDGYMRFKKRCKGSAVPPKNSKNKRHKLLAFLEESGAVTHRAEEPEVHIEEDDDTSQEEFDETQYEYDEKNFTFVTTDSSVQKIKREREEYPTSTPKRQRTYEDRSDREGSVVGRREDDVDLFCRHIAEVLRNLPPLYKAQAKKHISTVVSDYEIKAAQNCANTSEATVADAQDDLT